MAVPKRLKLVKQRFLKFASKCLENSDKTRCSTYNRKFYQRAEYCILNYLLTDAGLSGKQANPNIVDKGLG